MLPVLARPASADPEMEIDLRLSDVYADAMTSGLDAVVRVGEVADSYATSCLAAVRRQSPCPETALAPARRAPRDEAQQP